MVFAIMKSKACMVHYVNISSASNDFLFSWQAMLSLCSDESVSAKIALDLCINQMKNVLSSQQVPYNASLEMIGCAYHATETFVQVVHEIRNEVIRDHVLSNVDYLLGHVFISFPCIICHSHHNHLSINLRK